MDTSGITDAAAKLAAFGEIVKRSLNESTAGVKGNFEQAGQSLVRFGEDGKLASLKISSATAQSRGDLEELERRTRVFAENLEGDFRKGTTAVVRLGEDGSASLSRVSAQMQAANTSATQAAGGMASLGGAGVSMGAAIAGLAVVFSPVLAILGGFTAGLAASVSVMTLGVGAFGALAVGAVLLADKTGQLAAPMAALGDHVKAAADALGKQAAPAAAQVLNFVDRLIGPIQTLASHTLDWFNANGRLAGALQLAGHFADIFFASADRLGKVIGTFLDGFLARGPQWQSLFSGAMGVGNAAVQGLLTNLLRLSDWFTARLPTLGPATAQIMGKIGDVLQGVATAAGRVVDFFTAHWGQITDVVSRVATSIAALWKEIVEGWNFAQPALLLAAAGFQKLDPLLQLVRQHGEELKPILVAVGIAAAVVAGALVAVALASAGLTLALAALAEGVSRAIRWLVDNFQPALKQSGQRMSDLGSTVHAFTSAIGRDFDGIGSHIQGVIGDIGRLVNTIRNIPVVGGIASATIPGIGRVGGAFAEGGFAVPGSVFTVGERGPETGYALPGGGVLIQPNSDSTAGGTTNNYFHFAISGTGLNAEQIASAVDARLSRHLTST